MSTTKLNQAQRALVAESTYIVDTIVYSYYHATPYIPDFTWEDLIQTGYLALCEAALRYNGTGKFECFARIVVRSRLFDHFRSLHKELKTISLDAPKLDEECCVLHDFLVDSSTQRALNEFEVQDTLKCYKAQSSGIVRRGLDAIELKLQGYTYSEIAKMYGTQKNNVSAWISRVRTKLQHNPLLCATN